MGWIPVAPTFSALRGSLTARRLHSAPLLRRVQDGKEAGGDARRLFLWHLPFDRGPTRLHDPDLANIDHFDAGPDLLICQGRKPLVDERSDQANAEAMDYKKRSRRAISARGREHGESAVLVGTQA
jgi:hypothetical protein